MMIVKPATVPLNQGEHWGGGGGETFATECSAVDVDAELKKHSAPLK